MPIEQTGSPGPWGAAGRALHSLRFGFRPSNKYAQFVVIYLQNGHIWSFDDICVFIIVQTVPHFSISTFFFLAVLRLLLRIEFPTVGSIKSILIYLNSLANSSTSMFAIVRKIKFSLTYSILGSERVQRQLQIPEDLPLSEDVHVADFKIVAKKMNFSPNNWRSLPWSTHYKQTESKVMYCLYKRLWHNQKCQKTARVRKNPLSSSEPRQILRLPSPAESLARIHQKVTGAGWKQPVQPQWRMAVPKHTHSSDQSLVNSGFKTTSLCREREMVNSTSDP